jgi:hypothetical protein
MHWDFETPEGHTVSVVITGGSVAVSTRYIHGAVDGEVFDLEGFEQSVLPAMVSLANEDVIDEVRAALDAARAARDWDDDEIP